jgi:hypothetical protein
MNTNIWDIEPKPPKPPIKTNPIIEIDKYLLEGLKDTANPKEELQKRLDILKEWAIIWIEQSKDGQVIIRTDVNRIKPAYLVIRDFNAFVRYKTGNYISKAFKYREEIVAASYKGKS